MGLACIAIRRSCLSCSLASAFHACIATSFVSVIGIMAQALRQSQPSTQCKQVDLTDSGSPGNKESEVAAIAAYATVFVISQLGMHAHLLCNNHEVHNKCCKLGCYQLKGQPPPPSLPPSNLRCAH
eukprot:1398355-Rhodomonas_salina.3